MRRPFGLDLGKGNPLLDLVRVLVVGGDALQAADGDRLGLGLVLLLHPAAAARRLARAVAGAAEDPGEDVRLPIDHVRVRIPPGGDHADVLGNRGMGRAGPLAIDNLVKVVGITNIGRLHASPRSP